VNCRSPVAGLMEQAASSPTEAHNKSAAGNLKSLQEERVRVTFCIMQRVLVFLIAISSFFLVFSVARAADFSALESAGNAQVVQVIDPQTLQLHDGRLVRLAGLDVPYIHAREDTQDLSRMALKVLRDMLAGERVRLYQNPDEAAQVNRMGHHLMHVERAQDGQWLQGMLLSLGLARVYTTERNREMAAQMYALEKLARAEEIGIWSLPAYQVLSVEDAHEHDHGFVIVEGTVRSAALKSNRIYINFGDNWRTDFTIAIPSGARRMFSKAKVDPLQWGERRVRVRGWLEDYNGPYIEVNHPEAIELLAAPLPAP